MHQYAKCKYCLATAYEQLLDEGFFVIRNNQDRGKYYQPKPKRVADKLDYFGYHKNRIQ